MKKLLLTDKEVNALRIATIEHLTTTREAVECNSKYVRGTKTSLGDWEKKIMKSTVEVLPNVIKKIEDL